MDERDEPLAGSTGYRFDVITFDATQDHARHLDAIDPLAACRERFHIPATRSGDDAIYFCGNSLGLQPKTTRAMIDGELDDWAALAVDAHFKGRRPWYSYHEQCRGQGERLVGARPGAGEVVMMNSLTVNLHLMMTSFFRPHGERNRILIEYPAFPSDVYAVKTHLNSRGLDPDECLIEVQPTEGRHTLTIDDIEHALNSHGERVALVLLGGVNFFTGQVFDMERITELGHAQGCMVGLDLAHAAGNVPLHLHEWGVDFACWCSYKYLNAGPGAVAGCFVHERHAMNPDLPRLAGWWGNDPETRFRMHLEPEFIPRAGAEGWQVSNPPILALAPLKASLDIFDEVGLGALRAKSNRLTPYLRDLLEHRAGGDADRFEIITPHQEADRGCQLSILVHGDAKRRFAALQEAGVIGDFREPNVIRVAPVPLYNSFLDCWRFADILAGQG